MSMDQISLCEIEKLFSSNKVEPPPNILDALYIVIFDYYSKYNKPLAIAQLASTWKKNYNIYQEYGSLSNYCSSEEKKCSLKTALYLVKLTYPFLILEKDDQKNQMFVKLNLKPQYYN